MTYSLRCEECTVNCCNRGRPGSSKTLVHAEEIKSSDKSLKLRLITDDSGSNYSMEGKLDGSCINLDENNLCSVYEDRPLTCRMYPLTLVDYRVVGVSTKCPRYSEILDGVTNNDQNIIDWVMKTYFDASRYLGDSGVTGNELSEIMKTIRDVRKGYSVNVTIRIPDQWIIDFSSTNS